MMKYFSACLLLFCFFLLACPVVASYDSAFNDYTYAYNQYRTAHDNYQLAKSAFYTYRTLASQNDAITKFKGALIARNQVMLDYYDLLNEKILGTQEVSENEKSNFTGLAKSQKTWLTDHQKRIEATASLEDLNTVSSEFESRFPQMSQETKQAIGTILLAKDARLASDTEIMINETSTTMSPIAQNSDRGIISARSKLQLALDKASQAKAIFFPANNYSSEGINIFNGQTKLSESAQYLKEALNYLSEIVKGVTG